MFEEILGIPAHPLIVHAAVVFVPLQIAAALAYTFWPAARKRITWFVIGVLVIAPAAAWLAKLSGDAFRARQIRRGTAAPQLLLKFDQHSGFGNMALYFSAGLSVVMILLLLVRRGQGASSTFLIAPNGSVAVGAVLAVVTLAVAAATGYYIFRTGDTGAHMVWSSL